MTLRVLGCTGNDMCTATEQHVSFCPRLTNPAEGPATVTLTDDERESLIRVVKSWLPISYGGLIPRLELWLADLAADRADCNAWRDALAESVARTAAAEQVIANVRAALMQGGQTHEIRWRAAVNALPPAPTGDPT